MYVFFFWGGGGGKLNKNSWNNFIHLRDLFKIKVIEFVTELYPQTL